MSETTTIKKTKNIAKRGPMLRPTRPRMEFPGAEHWETLPQWRQDLVVQWTDACRKLSNEFEKRYGLEFGELLTVAFGIACRAAGAWDPKKHKFSTYLFASLRMSLSQHCERVRQSEKLRAQVWIPEYAPPTARPEAGAMEIEGGMERGAPWWWHELLSDRERLVVRMRADGCTMVAVAMAMGVTRQRVQQMQLEVARRLVAAGVATHDGQLAGWEQQVMTAA